MENTKSNKGLIVLLFVLLFGVIGFSGYYIYKTNSKKQDDLATINKLEQKLLEANKVKLELEESLKKEAESTTSETTKEDLNNENNCKNMPLSIFTANKKTKSSNDTTSYTIFDETDEERITVEKGNKVKITFLLENSTLMNFSGVSSEKDLKVKKNVTADVKGFDKNVVDVAIGNKGSKKYTKIT